MYSYMDVMALITEFITAANAETAATDTIILRAPYPLYSTSLAYRIDVVDIPHLLCLAHSPLHT